MKTKRFIFLLCALFLVVSTTSVSAGPSIPVPSTVNAPWINQVVKVGEDGISSLSTAFVGKNEVPFLSYYKSGITRIYQVFQATAAVPGNCPDNNAWVCTYWNDAQMAAGTLSNVATGSFGGNTFGLRWIYKTSGGVLRGAVVERMDDMTLATSDFEDLVSLSKFGGVLVGTPSIVWAGLRYRAAVVIREPNADILRTYLVYLHYTGNINTSCGLSTRYQCDVIESTFGATTISSPSLDVAPDGTVGIAYYFNGTLKYAYPNSTIIADCGPGGNTWKCLTISAPSVGTIGPVVKFDFGPTVADRGIVYTYKDNATSTVFIKLAEYVGSGGNCGQSLSVYLWKCTDISNLGPIATNWLPSFSIEHDPYGISAISYDHNPDDQSPLVLDIAYRLGTTWLTKNIEAGPTGDVDTGELTNLSFNSAGYGFTAYLKQRQGLGQLPDLKIALQTRQLFLPLTLK